MSDLIDREAAIETTWKKPSYTDPLNVLTEVRDRIKALPSAQPERKKGRWNMEPDPYGFFDEIPVCSECGCTTMMRDTYKFCPHCGADMRGEEDE